MLLGLDYILTPEREWVFLEANDHSNGLRVAHSFSETGQCGLGIGDPLSKIWRHIKHRANGKLVVALLPDRFVSNGYSTQASVKYSKDYLAQANVDTETIEELEWFIELLKLQGVEAALRTTSSLSDVHGVIRSDESVVGFLIRRAMSMPRDAYFLPSLNDIRARMICLDKLFLYSKIKDGPLKELVKIPETASSSAQHLLISYVSSLQTRPINYVIIKNRYGSQSENIARIPVNTLNTDSIAIYSADTHEYLVQDFIESDKIVWKGGPFSFDARVFTFNGELVGGYIRKAPAPTKDPFIDSPLSWLTTCGTLLPISSNMEMASGKKLDHEVIKSLKNSAIAVSELAESSLGEVSVDDTVMWLSNILPRRPIGAHFLV